MTLWKKNLARPGSPDPGKRPNLYLQLKKEIHEVRKQGELPAKVPGSFSRYSCDLCNSSFPIGELRQCSVCGRWACGSCWTPEYYVCDSCNGVIKLHQEKG